MISKAFVTTLVATVANAASGVFDYKQNGKDWGHIAGNELCDHGKEQSPIDLTGGTYSNSQEININNLYPDGSTSIAIKDHTVQVTVGSGGFEKVFESGSASDFEALQFHFHAPSENTINGKHMDLEMHIVHKYASTDPAKYGAVLGFMFDMEEGGSGKNNLIEQVSKVFNSGNTSGTTTNGEVWLKGFLDSVDTDRFWSFDGSLTTPPCSEGIKWTVFQQVLPISAEQLAKFTNLWADNANYAGGNGNNREV